MNKSINNKRRLVSEQHQLILVTYEKRFDKNLEVIWDSAFSREQKIASIWSSPYLFQPSKPTWPLDIMNTKSVFAIDDFDCANDVTTYLGPIADNEDSTVKLADESTPETTSNKDKTDSCKASKVSKIQGHKYDKIIINEFIDGDGYKYLGRRSSIVSIANLKSNNQVHESEQSFQHKIEDSSIDTDFEDDKLDIPDHLYQFLNAILNNDEDNFQDEKFTSDLESNDQVHESQQSFQRDFDDSPTDWDIFNEEGQEVPENCSWSPNESINQDEDNFSEEKETMSCTSNLQSNDQVHESQQLFQFEFNNSPTNWDIFNDSNQEVPENCYWPPNEIINQIIIQDERSTTPFTSNPHCKNQGTHGLPIRSRFSWDNTVNDEKRKYRNKHNDPSGTRHVSISMRTDQVQTSQQLVRVVRSPANSNNFNRVIPTRFHRRFKRPIKNDEENDHLSQVQLENQDESSIGQ
uniref:Uncharacterized protein n=1 Tax=Vespula pensylvanica TaxID=30213 RepID=A0A834MY65_VESPE|nr:hypothetical protein H0235_017946 [Vespula pensylvanica]